MKHEISPEAVIFFLDQNEVQTLHPLGGLPNRHKLEEQIQDLGSEKSRN